MPVAQTKRRYDNPDDAPETETPVVAPPAPPVSPAAPAPAPTRPVPQSGNAMVDYMMYRDIQREDKEERERLARQRAVQAGATVVPKGSTATRLAAEMESFAREQQAIQSVMAKFQPAPNPVIQVLDTEFGGKIGEVASTGITELIKMWREERMMKRSADEAARYSKTYDEMIAKYERALQLRMQTGDTSQMPPAPAPPQSLGMPGFPAPSGMAGQAIGLAQAYGQMPGGQNPLEQQQFGGSPPAMQAGPDPFPGGPAFGHSRPRVNMTNDAGPGGLPQSYPGAYGPGAFGQPQQDPMAMMRQELDRLRQQNAELQDRLVVQKPVAPAVPPAAPPLIPQPRNPPVPPQPDIPPDHPPADEPEEDSVSVDETGYAPDMVSTAVRDTTIDLLATKKKENPQ